MAGLRLWGDWVVARAFDAADPGTAREGSL